MSTRHYLVISGTLASLLFYRNMILIISEGCQDGLVTMLRIVLCSIKEEAAGKWKQLFQTAIS